MAANSSKQERDGASPGDLVRSLYERSEATTAQALEDLVAKRSFGWAFARAAENMTALIRISNDAADLVLRNLRIASRADITRLHRQLHRTEDKLERVLQEVELLRDELEHRDDAGATNRARTSAPAREKPKGKP